MKKCMEAGCDPLQDIKGTTPLHTFFKYLGRPLPAGNGVPVEREEDAEFVREKIKIFKAMAGSTHVQDRLNLVRLLTGSNCTEAISTQSPTACITGKL